jgi:hypothetical protein
MVFGCHLASSSFERMNAPEQFTVPGDAAMIAASNPDE